MKNANQHPAATSPTMAGSATADSHSGRASRMTNSLGITASTEKRHQLEHSLATKPEGPTPMMPQPNRCSRGDSESDEHVVDQDKPRSPTTNQQDLGAALSLTNGGFKNDQARQCFLEIYDELRRLSPPPDVVHDIATEFGTVRVYQHGPDRGVPVVLIHGFFMTSGMWWTQVGDLARDFTVYAMDMLGQPGASIQTRKMVTPADSSRNIHAVLDGLGLHSAHLVGHSYGGWLATHTAAREPSRVATLTLIDPAHTVVRLSPGFWRSLALLLSFPRSARAEHAAAWVTGHPAPGSEVDLLTKVFVAGFDSFAAPLNTPPVRFSGNELLRSVKLPVQVLLAGDSIHNAKTAIQRIESAVPAWKHRLWPGASHALPAEKHTEINACIRAFATEHLSGQA